MNTDMTQFLNEATDGELIRAALWAYAECEGKIEFGDETYEVEIDTSQWLTVFTGSAGIGHPYVHICLAGLVHAMSHDYKVPASSQAYDGKDGACLEWGFDWIGLKLTNGWQRRLSMLGADLRLGSVLGEGWINTSAILELSYSMDS